MDRFDKFTDRARKVLTLAQDEAQRFNHNYIGTEHLLLGLVREGEGVAARVLENMNVELAKVRTAVEFIIGRGDRPVGLLGNDGDLLRGQPRRQRGVQVWQRLLVEHTSQNAATEQDQGAGGVIGACGIDLPE